MHWDSFGQLEPIRSPPPLRFLVQAELALFSQPFLV